LSYDPPLTPSHNILVLMLLPASYFIPSQEQQMKKQAESCELRTAEAIAHHSDLFSHHCK
jgi:hypothetical protein